STPASAGSKQNSQLSSRRMMSATCIPAGGGAPRVHDTKTPVSGKKAKNGKVEKSPGNPRKFRKHRLLRGVPTVRFYVKYRDIPVKKTIKKPFLAAAGAGRERAFREWGRIRTRESRARLPRCRTSASSSAACDGRAARHRRHPRRSPR